MQQDLKSTKNLQENYFVKSQIVLGDGQFWLAGVQAKIYRHMAGHLNGHKWPSFGRPLFGPDTF